MPPCSAFCLLSSLSYSHAWPFAVAKATQVCTCNSTSSVPVEEPPPSRDPTTRPLRRSPRHPWLSTSDVGACHHRVVRRHTCCSPVTRKSMRATQARKPRLECTLASQPQRPHRKRAFRSSEECAGSYASHSAPITNRHNSPWLKVSVLILPCFGHFGSHFRARTDLPKKVPFGIRPKSTRPSEIRSSLHKKFR